MRNFLMQAKNFYIQQFLTIKGLKRKTLNQSILLLVIENIQLFSLITQSLPELENAKYFNPIHRILNLFRFFYIIMLCRFYTIIGDYNEIHIAYMLIGFALTFFSFIFFIVLIIKTVVKTQVNSQMMDMTLEINHPKMIEKNVIIKQFLSIYMQIFPYTIRIPLQYINIHIITNYQNTNSPSQFMLFGVTMSLLSVTFQFLFSFFVDLHCFEFKMKRQDFLGRFNTQRVHVIFAFETMIIILAGLDSTSIILQTLYIIYLILNILSSYYQLFYVEIQISRLQLQMSTTILFYQFVLLIAQYRNINFDINLMGLLLFVYPFCYAMLNSLIQRQKLFSLKFSSDSLEKQIRLIYFLFKKQIRLKKEQRSLDPIEALFLYSFISNHLRYCSLNRERKMQKQVKMKFKCFCEEFAENDNFRFDSIAQMKVFAKELIAQTLEDEIIENQDTYLALIYIYFLVQVKKLPTQAIYEVIRLSLQTSVMALKEQAIIYKLKYDALEEFEALVKKNDLKNQKYVFKRVYQYEESISIIKQNMCLIAKQFKEWYGIILTSIIDIDQLVSLGFNILKNIGFVEQQLQQAFSINPLSNECDTIYNLFQKYIQYNKSRPKLYRLEGKLVTQFMQSIEKTIFDPGSCVIQITLLQPRGNVLRYTRSFQQAIGFKDEEIKDQNIHRFMPQIIADDHDRYLDNFVERGRIIVVRSEVRVILGKNKGQFLVPINTRLRIETGPTEFGATALITPVNLTFGYMILNEKGQVEEITQNIFEEMFQKNLGIQIGQVRGLDCLFFVPELAKIWEEIYAENFDKLDRKFECQFIFPIISQCKSFSQSQISKTVSRYQIQKQIYRNFENQPTENAIYQIQLHVISLVTINLRLTILELQDFRVLPNQKITSKQIIQLRGRTSQQFVVQQFQNSTSYREQMSILNSPWVFDCDLGDNLLMEEERMIDEVKNQLATVNITNTTQHQHVQLIQYAQDEEESIDNQQDNQQQQQDEQIQSSINKIEDVKKAQYNHVNINNQSVDSRSSQNNQSSLKRQMKDCIHENNIINPTLAITLINFYILVIGAYIANCILFYQNFQTIQTTQKAQNLPFQLSYFYNEFIIASYYKEYDYLFEFSKLQIASLQFYQDQTVNLDQLASNIPEIDASTEITLKQKVIDIIQEMVAICELSQQVDKTQFLNNTNNYKIIVDQLYSTDTTRNILNIQYMQILFNIYEFFFRVLAEEIVLVLFLCWYAYQCLKIIKMKQKVHRLFSTFTTDVIQEQYIIFCSLNALMNNNKFKKEETDEEKFEHIMSEALNKKGSKVLLEKYQKVGKRLKQQKNNSTQIIFFLFVLILAIICSLYFIGSYIIHSDTIDQIITKFNDKILFSKAYHEITLAFSQTSVFIHSDHDSLSVTIHSQTLTELESLKKKLSLYQEDEAIYNIVTKAACNIFNNTLTGFIEYDSLFSWDQCMSNSVLQNGLSVIFQDLYGFQLKFHQDLQLGMTNAYLLQNYFSVLSQIERLYDSMGFFVIVQTLSDQIAQSVENNVFVNIIMVTFCGFLMSISMIIMVLSMRKVRHSYQTTKKLLTLLPYDRLLENAYIISFIQQDRKLNQ